MLRGSSLKNYLILKIQKFHKITSFEWSQTNLYAMLQRKWIFWNKRVTSNTQLQGIRVWFDFQEWSTATWLNTCCPTDYTRIFSDKGSKRSWISWRQWLCKTFRDHTNTLTVCFNVSSVVLNNLILIILFYTILSDKTHQNRLNKCLGEAPWKITLF